MRLCALFLPHNALRPTTLDACILCVGLYCMSKKDSMQDRSHKEANRGIFLSNVCFLFRFLLFIVTINTMNTFFWLRTCNGEESKRKLTDESWTIGFLVLFLLLLLLLFGPHRKSAHRMRWQHVLAENTCRKIYDFLANLSAWKKSETRRGRVSSSRKHERKWYFGLDK